MEGYLVVHASFDTIIVACKASLPISLCRELVAARERARERRSPEPVELGAGRVKGEVLPHGVQGGYDVVFSTGNLGEMFQFKTDQKGDKWPIRLKIRAASLLVRGYPGAVDTAHNNLDGIVPHIEEARLSEVHVCIDIRTSASFVLDENLFLRPGRAVVRPFDTFDDRHPLADEELFDPEMRRVLCGKRLQTLTIGSHATGSQMIIYNKRDEATLRRNWLLFEAHDLNRRDPSWSLWRYEVRFSGAVLKRHFRVRNFSDLDRKIQEMLRWATTRIRYVAPGQENLHPTRRVLHPFWQTVQGAIPYLSTFQSSKILPSVALEILDREKRQTLENCAVGLVIAHAAMNATSVETVIEQLPMKAADMVRRKLEQAPENVYDGVARAIARHRIR